MLVGEAVCLYPALKLRGWAYRHILAHGQTPRYVDNGAPYLP